MQQISFASTAAERRLSDNDDEEEHTRSTYADRTASVRRLCRLQKGDAVVIRDACAQASSVLRDVLAQPFKPCSGALAQHRVHAMLISISMQVNT